MSVRSDPLWVRYRPSAYDIVTCRYPEREKPDVEGPVLRPGLVTEVLRDTKSGRVACRVAYGTKHLKIMRRGYLDLIVQNSEDIARFGLARATRFDLDNTAVLPWQSPFFGCWPGFRTPVIGALTELYIREYAFLMMRRDSAGTDE